MDPYADGIDLTGLSERQKELLRECLLAQAHRYKRKRSWRSSEIAAATADIETLARKLGLPSIFKAKSDGS